MKTRIDQHLVASGLVSSLEKARALIGAGQVLVDEICVDKKGTLIDNNATIRLRKTSTYVSRGGLKLEKALNSFNINVKGSICIDVGASTGGFTDCLLQHGAKKIYAVDVAYGQLAWSLRQDDRVIVMERCNARHLTKSLFNEPINLAVIDASFISRYIEIEYLRSKRAIPT